MSKTTELTALMHRSSNVSCIRLLHLLHAFDSRSGLDDADGCAALTLPTLCLILRFAAPGSPPRFLFALSAESSLLRSGDRGHVWKKVGAWGCPGVRAAVTSSSLPAENSDTLQSITNLLPKDDGTSEEEEPSEPSKVRVVDSYGDTVVLGGNGSFLTVSGDRGLSFFAIPSGRLAPVLGPGADVSEVAVIDNTRILVAAGRNVAVYPLEPTGCGKVSLGAGQVVLQCVSRVILVKVCRFGLRTMIIASCTGYLYLSWNNGCDFLRIPHKLGGIRSLDPLGPVRHSMLASILSGAKGILAALEGGEAAAPAISKGSYQYASGCRSDYPFGDCGDYRAALGDFFQISDEEEHLYYRYFLAAGVGTEVLQYDYSCLLCIGIKVDEGSVTVFSHGTRVTYVPFSRSAPSEPVLCACSHEPGSSSVVFARCSSVGVGFSRDLAKWTVPQIASPVSLAACDAGELIVCTQRGMTVGVGSQGKRRAVPIAGDFRLSSVIDASYL